MHFDRTVWKCSTEMLYDWRPSELACAVKNSPLTVAGLAQLRTEGIGEVIFDTADTVLLPRDAAEAYDPRFKEHGFYDLALRGCSDPNDLLSLCAHAFYRTAPGIGPVGCQQDMARVMTAEVNRFYAENEGFARSLYDELHKEWQQPSLFDEEFLRRDYMREYENARAVAMRKGIRIVRSGEQQLPRVSAR